MAVNNDPFCYTRNKDGLPVVFKGLVQAGSTQAIKVGEICTWDETTGYFVPVDAVADSRYMLAIAKEEQKATGRGELTASRYIDFYALHPDDVFEFELAAARSLALGDPFTLTASNSQKLTYANGDFAVAICVDDNHYPQEEDTTIRNQSYARVSFNPAVTWWGYRMSQIVRPGRRVISTAADLTLKESDCYGGTVVLVTAAKTITLPAVKPGMDVTVLGTGANAINVDPDDDDKIRLSGAQLDDGDKLTSGGAAGDSVRLYTESADGWIAETIKGTWSDGS